MKRFFVPLMMSLFLAAAAVYAVEDDWRDVVPAQAALLDSIKTIPATFYVSLAGNDAWSGRLSEPNADGTDGPFRTFGKARAAVSAFRAAESFKGGPTVVEVEAGLYELDSPLLFDESDSGTEDSPVIWRGAPFGKKYDAPSVFLRGGKTLGEGVPVSDPAVLKRLKPEVRDKVLQFDLRGLGISDFGECGSESNWAELFFDGEPMTVSRFPNEGFLTIKEIDTDGNEVKELRGTSSYVVPKIIVDADDIAAWADEPEIWAHGYWCWDWLNTRQRVVNVTPESKKIELDSPYHKYGYRLGQYYYVYHLLCELDQPGEFYIDGDAGLLYFFPPKPVTEGSLFLTVQNGDVRGTGLHHFAFCGFGLDGCRGTALELNGENILVCDCMVRNVGGAGIVSTGSNTLVFGNHLYNLGARAIKVDAGDRKTLTPGHVAVVNNDIHHYARVNRCYEAGINFGGCGILAAHNRITNAPHNAILFSGNNHRIELNEIAYVCEESNDAGAVYCGRDWTMRGNVVKNNYFHNIEGFRKQGCVGVYLDDLFSSIDIVGNIFVNVTAATFIGGGRDSSIVNNIFVECHPAVRIDGRGMNWQADAPKGWVASAKNSGTIGDVSIATEPYASAYPKLRDVVKSENPGAPEGNVFARNVVIREAWNQPQPAPFEGDDIYDEARPYVTVSENVIGDYRLLMSLDKAPTPEIPNTKIKFDRIPAERIGLFAHPAATGRKF